MVRIRSWFVMLLVAGLGAGCGGSSAPPGEPAAAVPPPTSAAPSEAAEIDTVAALFPPGAGRDQLLNTCGSCHSVACTALGQRAADSWTAVKQSHRERISQLSAAELDAIFAYLGQQFNETRAEPKIAADLLQGGCTPF